MYIVFFSTSNVFKAEELLNRANITCNVVPTPATDRAYCGVCLKVEKYSDLSAISSIEYERIEE